jgi:hypothetical protein
MNKRTLGHAVTEPWQIPRQSPRPLLITWRSLRLNCEIFILDYSDIKCFHPCRLPEAQWRSTFPPTAYHSKPHQRRNPTSSRVLTSDFCSSVSGSSGSSGFALSWANWVLCHHTFPSAQPTSSDHYGQALRYFVFGALSMKSSTVMRWWKFMLLRMLLAMNRPHFWLKSQAVLSGCSFQPVNNLFHVISYTHLKTSTFILFQL